MSLFAGTGRRGGTRGGADQFSWEDVKNNKYKDYYLGQSLVTSGKPTFNNRKPNPLWYMGSNSSSDSEKELIKKREENLRNQALGLVPATKAVRSLKKNEQDELLKRSRTDANEDPDRIPGVGLTTTRQFDESSHKDRIQFNQSQNIKHERLDDAPDNEDDNKKQNTHNDDDEWEEVKPVKRNNNNKTQDEKKRKRKDESSKSDKDKRRSKKEPKNKKRREK